MPLSIKDSQTKDALETWPQGGEENPDKIDWTFVQTIFDMRSIIYPLTKRKAGVFGMYAALIALGVFLERKASIFEKSEAFLTSHSVVVALLIYGVEPLMLLVYLTLARYPYSEPESEYVSTRSMIEFEPILHENHDTALVIPCHLNASSRAGRANLREVLRAGLRHFPPSHIFIIDNGRAKTAPDNTQEVVYSESAEIHYTYYPYPSKSVAMYISLRMIKDALGEQIKFVLFEDSDTKIPATYRVGREFFLDERVKGLIYPILPFSTRPQESQLIRYQAFEYKVADLRLSALDALKEAPAPHGACVLLEMKTAEGVLGKHTEIFRGEDKETGDLLRTLYAVNRLIFRFDPQIFYTEAPESYLGRGGNLWTQRVRSWSEAPFLYPWRLALKPLVADWRIAPDALPIVKLDQLYFLMSECAHIMRYPVIALEARNPNFWMMFGLLSLTQLGILLLFNYKKLPPHLQSDCNTVLSFPLYKQVDNLMASLAFLRAVFFSWTQEDDDRPIVDKFKQGLLPEPESMAIHSKEFVNVPDFDRSRSEGGQYGRRRKKDSEVLSQSIRRPRSQPLHHSPQKSKSRVSQRVSQTKGTLFSGVVPELPTVSLTQTGTQFSTQSSACVGLDLSPGSTPVASPISSPSLSISTTDAVSQGF